MTKIIWPHGPLDQLTIGKVLQEKQLTPILSNCSLLACRRVVTGGDILQCNVLSCPAGVAARPGHMTTATTTTSHRCNYSPIISHSEPSWAGAGAGVSVTHGRHHSPLNIGQIKTMEAREYEQMFEEVSSQGDPRLLFANFTSSLLIVNSTLLTYAALGLLGLAGQRYIFFQNK